MMSRSSIIGLLIQSQLIFYARVSSFGLSLNLLFFLLGLPDHFPQDITMRLLKISVIIVQSLLDLEPTLLIEFPSNFIEHMHMQINSDSLAFLSDFFLKIFHHLMPDAEFPVRFEDGESQNVRVLLLLEIFNSSCVGAYDYIVVEAVFGMLCVFHCDFQVERCAVFYGQGAEIYLSQNVYVFIVDFAEGYFDLLPFCHGDIYGPTISNLILQSKQNYNIMRIAVSKTSRAFCSSASRAVTLKLDEDKKVARISLTNPKKRNTLSLEAINLLKSSLSEVEQKVKDKKTKIVILDGEGPVFCSGHDLKQLGKASNPKQIFDSCAELMLKIRNFPVPTLCVINGIAAAAGFQMALACDLVIASQKSTFSTPGVKWGLFCSTPAVELIRAINSQKKAMEMLLFGESISAEQAFRYGLLNRVVPENKLDETINEFVTKANNLSGEVITHGKSILRSQQNENVEKAYCIAGEGMNTNIKQKQDCKEGLKAFSEKRHPHYKN